MGEAAQALKPLSLEKYLEREVQAHTKHELAEGLPYTMAGASRTHALTSRAFPKGTTLRSPKNLSRVAEGKPLGYPKGERRPRCPPL